MSKYLGDFAAGDTIDFKFTTFRPSTGAAFTLAGSPAVSIYKDNSTTESTSGVTLTTDFDSRTGLNHVRLTTSSDGTFYADGSQFEAVITAGTVDSVSVVGASVGRFTLRAQAALYPTTAGRKLDVSSTGEAGIDFANIGSPTTTVNLSGTTVKAVTDMVTANVTQISGDATAADNLEAAADGTGYNLGAGQIVAASVTGAVTVGTINANTITATSIAADAITAAKVAADVATENAAAVWGAHLTTYTDSNSFGGRLPRTTTGSVNEIQITNDNHVSASVHEMQANVVTAASIAAGAIDANAIAANAIDASALATDAVTEIAQGVLTEATSTTTYAAGDVGNVLARLHNMIAADGADYQYTANALELAPSGGGGGGSTTVRMGPFTVKADGQASDLPLDINKGATHGIDCVLVDAQGTGVDLTGATLSTKVYSTSGTLVATISGTATYAAGGAMTWTIPTSVTNTAGTYTATITRTTGASDTEVFGPLRIYVRDI